MRRFLATLLACMLLACAPAFAQQLAAIPALDGPVIDTTNTLQPAQVTTLDAQARALQKRKGSQLQILMVPTTQPETIEQYTVRAFEQFKLGRKGVDDGVLIVVAKDDRRVRIEPGYGLEGAIPDAIANRVIQEYLAPKFRANDYGGGLIDATAALVKIIDGEPLPAPIADNTPTRDGRGGNWLFALFAAFLAAQVARGIFSFLPAGIRGIVSGGVSGGIAWLIAASLVAGGIGGIIGLFIGLAGNGPGGRFARHGGWGGMPGGWGGGGGGGFGGGGGGWSGGGGRSGGGGASGSW
jgi:uncharacterized protein